MFGAVNQMTLICDTAWYITKKKKEKERVLCVNYFQYPNLKKKNYNLTRSGLYI